MNLSRDSDIIESTNYYSSGSSRRQKCIKFNEILVFIYHGIIKKAHIYYEQLISRTDMSVGDIIPNVSVREMSASKMSLPDILYAREMSVVRQGNDSGGDLLVSVLSVCPLGIL